MILLRKKVNWRGLGPFDFGDKRLVSLRLGPGDGLLDFMQQAYLGA